MFKICGCPWTALLLDRQTHKLGGPWPLNRGHNSTQRPQREFKKSEIWSGGRKNKAQIFGSPVLWAPNLQPPPSGPLRFIDSAPSGPHPSGSRPTSLFFPFPVVGGLALSGTGLKRIGLNKYGLNKEMWIGLKRFGLTSGCRPGKPISLHHTDTLAHQTAPAMRYKRRQQTIRFLTAPAFTCLICWRTCPVIVDLSAGIGVPIVKFAIACLAVAVSFR